MFTQPNMRIGTKKNSLLIIKCLLFQAKISCSTHHHEFSDGLETDVNGQGAEKGRILINLTDFVSISVLEFEVAVQGNPGVKIQRQSAVELQGDPCPDRYEVNLSDPLRGRLLVVEPKSKRAPSRTSGDLPAFVDGVDEF